MKKILSISLILATALTFSSCVKEEDDIFDKSAAERLNEASDLYSSRLMAAPNGWAMQLYPTNDNEWPYGTGYLLLCRFNKDHSVNVAMNNIFSNSQYLSDTSLWEVITDNGPVLSFNSHNDCVHAFSDPYDLSFTGTAAKDNNESGTGAEGDYEFIIVDAPEDASYMMLKGKKRGTYNLLTPVEEGMSYEQYLMNVKTFRDYYFAKNVPTFYEVHWGDSLCKMTMSYPDEAMNDKNANASYDGIPNIYPYHGSSVFDQTFNTFLITMRGNDYYLRFRDRIHIGDVSVQEFRYDKERDIFVSVDNDNYYICGDDPTRFFSENIYNIFQGTDKLGWRFYYEGEMSDSWKAEMDAINADFQAQKNPMTLVSMAFKKENNDLGLALITTYKTKSGNSNVTTYYDVNSQADGVTLTFNGNISRNGDRVLDMVPALKTFVTSTINQKFIAKKDDTGFNLNTLHLCIAGNEDKWVKVNHYDPNDKK